MTGGQSPEASRQRGAAPRQRRRGPRDGCWRGRTLRRATSTTRKALFRSLDAARRPRKRRRERREPPGAGTVREDRASQGPSPARESSPPGWRGRKAGPSPRAPTPRTAKAAPGPALHRKGGEPQGRRRLQDACKPRPEKTVTAQTQARRRNKIRPASTSHTRKGAWFEDAPDDESRRDWPGADPKAASARRHREWTVWEPRGGESRFGTCGGELEPARERGEASSRVRRCRRRDEERNRGNPVSPLESLEGSQGHAAAVREHRRRLHRARKRAVEGGEAVVQTTKQREEPRGPRTETCEGRGGRGEWPTLRRFRCRCRSVRTRSLTRKRQPGGTLPRVAGQSHEGRREARAARQDLPEIRETPGRTCKLL